MRALTREGKKNDLIRRFAAYLTQDLASKDWVGEVGALFDYVKDEIRYQLDTTDTEVMSTAQEILLQGFGDCDDKAVLLAALLESIGHHTGFAALAFTDDPQRYSHVIVLVWLRGRWVTLDATEPQPLGWAPPGSKLWLVIFNQE